MFFAFTIITKNDIIVVEGEKHMNQIKKPYTSIDAVFSNFNSLYGESNEYQINRYNEAFDKFKNRFSVKEAYVASSSGRAEIIGNHTDHNGGKVISCAISLDTLAMFLPRDDGKICVVSEGYKDMEVEVFGDKTYPLGTSLALIKGVVEGFKARSYNVGGFNAYFTSNVLGGAGISSSASFEVLVAEILNFLYNDGNISCEEKAKISQFSEREYFGKPCGLLDQTAIAYGGLNRLDFKAENIEVSKIDVDLKDYALILVNTGGSHANLTGEYASVPGEMFEVAKALGKERLIDLSKKEFIARLPEVASKLSDRAVLRAFHFYEENERVDLAYQALQKGDYDLFIQCVNGSGISSLCKLQNCYVNGDTVQSIPKALAICSNYLHGGANRVHGGGFAGSILNVVKKSKVNDFVEGVSKFYDKKDIVVFALRSCGTIVL